VSNLAVVVDPDAPGRLVLKPVPEPVPDRGEAIVRVRAISLNRGEVRRSTMAAAGWRPGWDLAGVIERAAADGTGPKVGERVVGFLPEGAWAQRVAVPKNALAELPEKVTFSQAATFPVAGLTALLALGKSGPLLGKRVLITGATGGVGDFAVQLARLAGVAVDGEDRMKVLFRRLRNAVQPELQPQVVKTAGETFVCSRSIVVCQICFAFKSCYLSGGTVYLLASSCVLNRGLQCTASLH